MSSVPSQHEVDRYAAILAEALQIKGVSLWQDACARLRRNWAAMIALVYLIVLGVAALLTPLWPLQSPIVQDLANRQFLPPSLEPFSLQQLQAHDEQLAEFQQQYDQAEDEAVREILAAELEQARADNPLRKLWHNPSTFDLMLIRARLAIWGDWCIPSICGTDFLGRDLLSRIFWGARVSLMVGLIASLVSLAIGVTYGATAGYLGGWVDNAMMRLVDVLYSIPFIFVVIFLITFLTSDEMKARLENYHIDQLAIFYIVIGAIYWLTMSRVVRGQVISLKNEQFIEAARTIGASRPRIILRHLVPNVMSVVIVYLTLTIPAVMLFEAFLSFLGLGVTEPDVSWGLLANKGIEAITPVKIFWWLVVFPGLALAVTLLSLMFLGDGLRDALDPKMKNR